ncbi:MAG: REP-associated tyrosine transposase [Desulfobaccales bacterium]
MNGEKKNGGTGVPPVHSFKITQRTLPHWQQPGSVYFLTWRWKKGNVLSPEERTITLQALQYWDGRKWTLYAAVIMPDHVHVLVQPLVLPESEGVYNLAEIIHSVKSFSVHKINRQRGSSGSIWQDERFDRIVRDEAEFLEKWQYIMNNPLKKELVQSPEDYFWLYAKND